jgi:hypothetical protein
VIVPVEAPFGEQVHLLPLGYGHTWDKAPRPYWMRDLQHG